MEQYINPPEKVREIGRCVGHYPVSYDDLQNRLARGEALYAYCERGLSQLCVHISSLAEFDEFFDRQCEQGFLLSVRFYAVPVS